MFSVAAVAAMLAPVGVAIAAVEAADLARGQSSPWPGAANTGAGVSAMIVPAMLSPPTLTGVMPA
jgi:hypothetical protein